MSSTALKDANYFGEEFGGKRGGGMYKPQYRISEGFFLRSIYIKINLNTIRKYGVQCTSFKHIQVAMDNSLFCNIRY